MLETCCLSQLKVKKEEIQTQILTWEICLNERRKPCEGEVCDGIMGPLFFKLFNGLGDTGVALRKLVVLLTVSLAIP